MLQIGHRLALLAIVALLGGTGLAPAAETGGAVTAGPTSNAATPGSPTLNAADPSATGPEAGTPTGAGIRHLIRFDILIPSSLS